MLGDVLDGPPRTVRSSNDELGRGVRHRFRASDDFEAHQSVVCGTEPDSASPEPPFHAVALRLKKIISLWLRTILRGVPAGLVLA